MTTQAQAKLTGLVYWSLIHPYRDRLKARIPFAATILDIDTDALIVAIGNGCPYRLLVVNGRPDGLVELQVWECGRKVKLVFVEACLSDLVDSVINKIVKLIGH